MLDRYPELVNRVELCISLSGITSGDEFVFGEDRKKWQLGSAKVLTYKIPSTLYRYTVLSKPWIHATYSRSRLGKAKFVGMTRKEKKQALRQEVILWQSNDVRTWAKTIVEMLTADNRGVTIDQRVWHVQIKGDQYLNGSTVVDNHRSIFKSVRVYSVETGLHSPVMIDTEEKGLAMLPKKLRHDLSKFAR